MVKPRSVFGSSGGIGVAGNSGRKQGQTLDGVGLARRSFRVAPAAARLAVPGCLLGETCSSIRAKLNRLDSKGVPAYVEAQSQGKKLAGQQKTDADAYNNLLNQYLGARCHEAPKT